MTLPAIVFALGLLISPAYLWLTNRPPGHWRSVVKTLPLLLFALAAWRAGAPPFLVLGLFFGALGDLALSRDGRAAFLYGLGAFGLGHLMYVLLFSGLGAGPVWDAFGRAPAAAVALLALALSSELWLAPHTGAMRWPVRGYVALIAAMGLTALALPAGYGAVVLGAGLFILSDVILSLRLFRMAGDDPRAVWAGRVLWVAYIAGQALITAAIATL